MVWTEQRKAIKEKEKKPVEALLDRQKKRQGVQNMTQNGTRMRADVESERYRREKGILE